MSESTEVLAYRVRDALLGKRVPRQERLAANEAFVVLLARLMSERDEAREILDELAGWQEFRFYPGDTKRALAFLARTEASPHD